MVARRVRRTAPDAVASRPRHGDISAELPDPAAAPDVLHTDRADINRKIGRIAVS